MCNKTTKIPWKGLIFLFVLLLLPGINLFAQGTITGKVTDTQDKPIIGVNVILLKTTLGAATDNDGSYKIANVPAGNYTIKFSAVGYKSQEFSITVESGQTIKQNAELESDILNLHSVVVTGVQNPQSKLNSSVAITTISARAIEQKAPQSTADLIKSIPGFYVESSGGDVGNNVFPRGIPSEGSYQYVQLQEDGLPVFDDGELQFANADNFVRIDQTIERVESVRGGSGSIFATNAPGGIINFISKTGGPEFSGTGKLTLSDYNTMRADIDFGGPITEKLRYNVGGFYRYDEGIRSTGYPANYGGQLKANLTYLLNNGYVRAYYKKLDDRNLFYLPIPLKNPSDPTGINGFDPNYGTFASVNASVLNVPQPGGTHWIRDLENGIHPVVDAIGGEVSLDLGHGFSFKNSMRSTTIDMNYDAIFPGAPPTNATVYASSAGITNPIYSYADNGQVISNPGNMNGNGLVAQVGFWTILKQMNDFDNNLQFTFNSENNSVQAGYYFSSWKSHQYWNWSNILLEIKDQARMLNLANGDLQPGDKNYSYTYNGVTGISFLTRESEIRGRVNAFYLNDEFTASDKVTIDAGIRYDADKYTGYNANTKNVNLGDSTTMADDNVSEVVGPYTYWTYDVNELSASGGINYAFNKNVATYIRISRGVRSPDEASLHDNVGNFGALKPTDIKQYELGFKYSSSMLGIFANAFYMTMNNISYQDVLANGQQENKFADADNIGLEIEAIYNYENFNIDLTGTFQNPKYKNFAGHGFDYTGNEVRRIPKIFFIVTPRYEFITGLEAHVKFSFFGSKYSDDANLNKLPSYNVIDAGASYKISDITFAADGTNLANTIGLTEGNPRSTLAAGEFFMARPILGRAFRFSVLVNF
ncbi:MAG: TonB-dependent receptor [Ignavibacteriaceae bacterium]